MPDHYSLICRARNGESQAFEELMRRYERLIYKIAASFTHDRENALDLTQNVFLKAFAGLDRLEPDCNFKAWLTRIATNEGINWNRRHQRHTGHESMDEAVTVACPLPGPWRCLDAKVQQQQIRRGVGQLRPRYRLAISLRYFQGLKVREIADVLDCSESMAKHLLYKGVRSLRAWIADTSFADGPFETGRPGKIGEAS